MPSLSIRTRGDRSAAQICRGAGAIPAGRVDRVDAAAVAAVVACRRRPSASVHASRNGNNSQGEAVVSASRLRCSRRRRFVPLPRLLAHRHRSHNPPRFVVISILNRDIHERKREHPEARGGRTRRRRGQQQNVRTNSLLGLPKERRKTQAAVLEQGFIVDQFEAAMMMTAAVRHCRLTDGRTERDGGGRTEWCSCCSSLPASRRCPRVRPIVHASNLFIYVVGASGVRCVRVHPLPHFEQKFHIFTYTTI